MKLIKIGAKNLKGMSFDLPLTPATFLVGPNYCGKTARTDAIRLLLVGYLPELGKTNAATFGLSSGKELVVTGTFMDKDGGPEYVASRRWFLDGDSVKTSKSLPPALDLKGDDTFEVMLNAESWFGLTENERVEWVFRNLSVKSDLKPEKLLANVRVGVETFTEEPAVTVDSFFEALGKRIRDAEREEEMPFSIRQFVAVACEKAAEIVKSAKEYAVRMDKTASGLAALRASDEAPVDLAPLAGDIDRINGELNKLRDERAAVTAKIDGQRGNAARRERLTRELASRGALIARREEAFTAGKKNQDEGDALKSQLAAMPENATETINELRREERAAADGMANQRADLLHVVMSTERNEKERDALDAKETCPYCGASGSGWKTLKAAEINSALAGLASKKVTLDEHIAKISEHLEAVRARIRGAEASVNERMALWEKIKTADHRHRGNVETVAGLDAQLLAFAGKQGELDAIPPEDPSAAEILRTLDSAVAEKRNAISGAEAVRAQANGRQNDVRRLAEAEKARGAAHGEEAVGKLAVDALKAVKAQMVAEAFEPLLAAANAFCGPLLKTPLAFNPANSEVGRYENGLWIGHKTFSGVEKLLAYAGIQAAFAAKAPVRVMILDEMLRAHGDVFHSLLETCVGFVKSGKVDNFCGIIPGEAKNYSTLSETDCQVVEVI